MVNRRHTPSPSGGGSGWGRALTLFVAALVACSDPAPSGGGAKPGPVAAKPAPEPPPEAPADPGYIAVVAPRNSVELAPTVPGEIVEVHVATGDRVETDALIATLDNRPAREALAVARAEAESARAARARTDVDVADKERQLEVAKKEVEAGLKPAKHADDARFEVDRAKALRRQAGAAVAEARARVKTLERQLGETKLRAPFAGTVAMRYRNAGAIVGPGIPVVRIISGDELSVILAVPPDEAGNFAIDDALVVDVAGLTAPLAAKVREVAPELDPASRMLYVEAELAVPDDLKDRVPPGADAWVRRANARD